jgi:uncharacterized protein with PQ loop repeat
LNNIAPYDKEEDKTDVYGSFEHKIFLKDLDNYFSKTKGWINTKESKILEEKEPEFIRIIIKWGFRMPSWIYVEFRFIKDNNSITMKIISGSDSLLDEKYLVRWKLLIEEYYNYIGVTLDDKILKEIYSQDDLKYIIKVAVIDLLGFSIFLYGIFVIRKLFIDKTDPICILKWIIGTYWLVLIFYEIIFRPFRKILKCRKLKKRLYPSVTTTSTTLGDW